LIVVSILSSFHLAISIPLYPPKLDISYLYLPTYIYDRICMLHATQIQ